MKKLLSIFLFLTFLLFCNQHCTIAADNGGHAGTPPGFYDDINPDTPEYNDNEDDLFPPHNNANSLPVKQNKTLHEFSENSINIQSSSQAKLTENYSDIYNNLEPATHSYLHGIDPDEFYDVKDAAWSIYPLLRLNSAIYFKNITIEPGYYLLTPREHKGKWYILFKQNGKVVYIIPVYNRDYTPEKFYDEHIPKPKLTKSQKIHMGILNTIGKTKSSKRREPVKSFLEVNDLDNYFINIIIYYGGHKYSTIYRTIRL